MEVAEDCGRRLFWDHRAKRFQAGFLDSADAAEVLDEASAGCWTNACDFLEFAFAVANLAALAMISDSEAVALVANSLD